MASDITLAVGDGSRRMSYAALAEARGISVLAARQLTRRHRWHKQVGNDGFVVVSVPLSALENPQKSAKFADAASRHSINATDTASIAADAASDTASDTVSDTASDAASSEIAIRAVEALREQLDRAEADKTELRQQLGRERERADRAEQQVAEARVAERKAIELVKYVTAEASDQRRRADDAATSERIARDEAAGLRAELDARKQWGLWRRVRGR
jgi:hypothetical protein